MSQALSKQGKVPSFTLSDLEDFTLEEERRLLQSRRQTCGSNRRSNPNDASAWDSFASSLGSNSVSGNVRRTASASTSSRSIKSVPKSILKKSSSCKAEQKKTVSLKEEESINYWNSIYSLFDLFDEDGNGTIDFFELEYGIKLIFLRSDNPHLSFTAVSQVINNVFPEHSDEIEFDRKAFGHFFFHLSKAAGMPLEELAAVCSSSLLSENIPDHKSCPLQTSHTLDFDTSSDLSSKVEGWGGMQDLFDIIDADNNGRVDRDEIAINVRDFCQASDLKLSTPDCLELLDDIYCDECS